ncbi:hypothetical protein ZIOFF_011381 [Zingiber officinale]|uniref:Uncharacterized protein n=1 Tax=Zingiber officinale TaxID=94328 RepID=A0A8J5HQB8_ZINOF|nr:hypothetical protein ZIOFF_011381 [Zingiber officinale]
MEEAPPDLARFLGPATTSSASTAFLSGQIVRAKEPKISLPDLTHGIHGRLGHHRGRGSGGRRRKLQRRRPNLVEGASRGSECLFWIHIGLGLC